MKKRILLYFTMSIFIIGLLTTSVIASLSDLTQLNGTGKSEIGKVFTLSCRGTLESSNNAYCIQKNKKFKGEVKFVLRNYVEIDGKQSTAYSSATDEQPRIIESDLNAEVAYILNKNQGYGTTANPTDAQNALWYLSNSWTSDVFGDITYVWKGNKNLPRNKMVEDAEAYASVIGDQKSSDNQGTQTRTLNVVDKTEKDNISKIDVGENYRVGPFKWEFEGTLQEINVTGDKEDYSTYKIIKYVGDKANEVNASDVLTGESFYIDIPKVSNNTQIKGLTLKTTAAPEEISKIYVAKIWFFHSNDNQNIIYVQSEEREPAPLKGEANQDYNLELLTDIGLVKVDDRNEELPLKGVGFKFKAKVYRYNDEKQTWEWVYRYLGKDLCWSETDINNSKEYLTNKDGKIEIEKISGETVAENSVKAVEVSNPYYGYNNNIGKEFNVGTIAKIKNIVNHQSKVKLSGYVWKDIQLGKTSARNDVYDKKEEEGIDGITVYLKDKKGKEIAKTETSELNLYSEIKGGEYQFVDVDLDKIEAGEYYVEFEYCGITYQSVSRKINENNGSKAIDTATRKELDKKFDSVDGNGTQSLNVNGVKIKYNDISKNSSTIKGHSGCEVYARTNEVDDDNKEAFDLYSNFVPGSEEIRYVNLGLFEKALTDYSLSQDLDNVKIDLNGFSHVYKYGTVRFNQDGTVNESAWNMGVKFQNNTGTYNRAIYKADAEFESKNHKDNEIKVYVTYKMALTDESSYYGRINSIVDYCDSRMDLIKAGTEIDNETAKVKGNIKYSEKSNYNDEYSKYIIDANIDVKPYESTYIYLQFKLERSAILTILNNNELINNVAEINSYTTFKDESRAKTVAVIDKDSVPGNMIPGNIDTYEDDTDAARSLQLELKNERALSGTVFVDNTGKDSDKVYSYEERKGNGIFDEGEKTISGVSVKMKEVGKEDSSYDDERVEMTTTTDENGNFEFVGFIPGNYIITYTWGDKTYKVQYYKGTVYDESRDQSNKYWYKDNSETRKTDALDSADIRTKIDTEMQNIKYNTLQNEIEKAYNEGSELITQKSMDSSTPVMSVSVEYDTTITDGNDNQVRFTINNIDFGIVERPKQQLDLSKRISGFKIILANGSIIADVEVTEDGKLKGSHDYVSYLAPTQNTNGIIRTEVDNEIIQGATLEITYTMKATNTSELDYISDRYYYYGNNKGAEAIKVSATSIVDYLDNRLKISDDKWDEKDKKYLEDVNAKQKDNEDYLKAVSTYQTSKLTKDLAPKESNEITLKATRLLASSEDNSFDNESEIVEIEKTNTNTFKNIGTPVMLSWNEDKAFFDNDKSETFVVIPSTGKNKSYAMPIIIGITSLMILGVGTFSIKRFILSK